MTAVPRLLLVTQSADTREQWSGLLTLGGLLVTTPDDLRRNQCVDVILADQRLPAELHRLVEDGTSVIQVGTAEPCDLPLEADVSEAEILLACRLQARISRLTRESTSGERERKKLTDLTLTDPLTGLRNRRAWDEQAAGIADSPGGVCLMLIDLDRFKAINDARGHTTGDAVLQATAAALRVSLRPDDFVVRLGGDEFAVLIPQLGDTTAAAVADRIRQSILSHSETAGQRITSSVGFVVSSGAASLDSLFRAADEALRRAKASGRDTAVQGRPEP